MSHSEHENYMDEPLAKDQEEQDAFLDQSEIGEVVADDGEKTHGEPYEEDLEDDEKLEVDFSNNSYSYFDTHTDSIYCIASHPTLPMVLTGGGDDKAYLWTTHSSPSKLVVELTGQQESVVAGGFTCDGKYVVTGDMNGQLRVWKAKAGGEKWEFITSVQEVEEVIYIKFHPSLPIIAVGAEDGSIWVYELANKFSQVAVLNAHAASTTNALFVNTDDHDWLTLISLSEDSTIICWNVYQSQTIYVLEPKQTRGEHPWVSICASPDGKKVAIGAIDGFLIIIKVMDGTLLHHMSTVDNSVELEARSVEGLSWSDKTGLLATGNVSGQVQLYSPVNWKIRVSFKLEDSITKLEFIGGHPLLAVSAIDETMAIFDALNGNQVWKGLGQSSGVLGFVLQDNGKRVITADDDGIALVFKVE